MENIMKIDNGSFEGFEGVTAGVQEAERWQYDPIGYNATKGVFYIGEVESPTLDIVPFALRQCKEVTDADGITHRYPIKTRRADMADGDMQTRLQVAGMVDGTLHTFGARSWTARAAWSNPIGGPYHDGRFEGGIWPRLLAHIKTMQQNTGKLTAPLCWRLHLEVGEAVDLASAANSKQKASGHPIKAVSMAFVGVEKALEHEQLYTTEALDEWVREWNVVAVTEATPEPTHAPIVLETLDDDVPF